jgi:hypothetical protein
LIPINHLYYLFFLFLDAWNDQTKDFRILLERTLDFGEIVAAVAERTGLKSPRKAVTEVLRACRKAGIVVGGGKGSTKYRLAEME